MKSGRKETHYDSEQFGNLKKEKHSLRMLAMKIDKIPSRFAKADGSLDLDKVHAVMLVYQNGGGDNIAKK